MSNSLATRQSQQLASLKQYLFSDAMKANMAMALPKHMNPERLLRVAITQASKNPSILECTQDSFAKAMIECSEMGLEPNGRDCYLVPFKNTQKNCMEITVIPGYMGLIKLGYQSGQVNTFFARAVRAKDRFKFKYGTGAFIDHEPANEADRGPLVYAWAMASLKQGGDVFVVLNASEVEQRKKASRSSGSSSSPWQKWPDAMWAKSAVRELSKFVPLSPELERAIEVDNENDVIDAAFDVLPGAAEQLEGPQETKSQRLANAAKQSKGEASQSKPADKPADQPSMSERVRGYDAMISEAADVETLRQIVRDSAGDDQLADDEKQEIATWCQSKAERLKAGKDGDDGKLFG